MLLYANHLRAFTDREEGRVAQIIRDTMPAVEEHLRGCVQFELQLGETIDDKESQGVYTITAHTEASSTVSLELRTWGWSGVTLQGKADIHFTAKSGTLDDPTESHCHAWDVSPSPGSLSASARIRLVAGAGSFPSGSLEVDKAVLTVPETADEILVGKCKKSGLQAAFGKFGKFSTTFPYHRDAFPGQPVTISEWDGGDYPVMVENLRTAHHVAIVRGIWNSTESARLRVVHAPK
jgi:hypothetical protein